ncbi:MAG: S41 family peptidase [Erysipelotrichaceae bacterium]
MENKKTVRYKLVRHKWPDEVEAEKKKRNRRIATVTFCIVCFCLGFFASNLYHGNSSNNSFASEKFDTIYQIMKNEWYFGKDSKKLDEQLMSGAIEGMVNSGGDIHTRYMDADVSKSFASSLEGHFYGIGIQYYKGNDQFIVDRVFLGSPAQEVGIVKGDIIHKVEDKTLEKYTSDEVSKLIKGKSGTTVKIEVLRENKAIEFNVERREVNNSVFGEVKDQIGILEISSFADTTGEEVGQYLKNFQKQGVNKLVIDLRDNGGGYLVAAVDIASYLLEEGKTIFKQENIKGEITPYYVKENTNHFKYDDIAILVNGDTASASEVLAACLREQVGAKLIGTKTYGKGTIQITAPFKDNSTLKYTTGEWLTSKGKKINGKGLQPDIKISLDEALMTRVPQMKKDVSVKVDSVSTVAKVAQIHLGFLGYDVDRKDEYFSYKGSAALKQYQRDKGLEVTGEINNEVLNSLLSSSALKWREEESQLDLQMQKAFEVLHG